MAIKRAVMKARALLTQEIHNKFKVVFTVIGCFKGTYSLQVKEGVKPYQVPSRCITYVLQTPIRDELGQLQKQQLIIPLDVYETSNSAIALCCYPSQWKGKTIP